MVVWKRRLQRPCTDCYRSSRRIIAVNFEKNAEPVIVLALLNPTAIAFYAIDFHHRLLEAIGADSLARIRPSHLLLHRLVGVLGRELHDERSRRTPRSRLRVIRRAGELAL